MDLPKCKTCGERHRLGGCPSNAIKSRGGVEKLATSDNVKRQERVAGKDTRSATIERRGSDAGPRDTKSKGGRPLAKDADKALMQTKPWLADGMSRASWYRRQAEKKESKG